jgi:hypothetical protein
LVEVDEHDRDGGRTDVSPQPTHPAFWKFLLALAGASTDVANADAGRRTQEVAEVGDSGDPSLIIPPRPLNQAA